MTIYNLEQIKTVMIILMFLIQTPQAVSWLLEKQRQTLDAQKAPLCACPGEGRDIGVVSGVSCEDDPSPYEVSLW